MRLSAFDFDLPEELIALRPAVPRRSARLLVVRPGEGGRAALEHARIEDLPRLLSPGDMMVFNDTRVIAARLEGVRARGEGAERTEARIEATLIERLDAARWRALCRPAKRLRAGDRIVFAPAIPPEGVLSESGPPTDAPSLAATVAAPPEAGEAVLAFELGGAALDAALARIGAPPLPPYIAARRRADARDREDYQTVFARNDGAVAAPTAALHFDPPLLEALAAAGIGRAEATLHVGAGTFLPVKTDDVSEHRMHAEEGALSAEAAARINAARQAGGRVVAVGTTALRLLETAAAEDGSVAAWRGATDLFITPGYRLRAVDALLTNFHLPRSTLFMLVCAVMGREPMLHAYREAVEAGYRFYSYGDACLLLPGRNFPDPDGRVL